MNKKNNSEVETAIILAAGLGSRLGSLGREIPKGFINVGGKALIETSIELLRANEIKNIIIGCGHLQGAYEELKHRFNVTLYTNSDFQTTGSLATLVRAERHISESFLLLESDLLYEDLALSSLLAHTSEDVILASGKTHSGDEVYMSWDQQETLIDISKDQSKIPHYNGELVGLSKLSLRTFRAICKMVNESPHLEKIHYEEGFVELQKQSSIRFKVEKIEDLIWCEVDTIDHLKHAEEKVYPLLRQL